MLYSFNLFDKILNHTVTWLLGGHHHHHNPHQGVHHRTETSVSQGQQANSNEEETEVVDQTATEDNKHQQKRDVEPHPACCSDDPAGDLANMQRMAEEIDAYEHTHQSHWHGAQSEEEDDSPSATQDNQQENQRSENDHKKLMRMSLNTALAIGLHNFPEGLATFVAALSDPSVGAVLAVAIAIHNVPEGLCVAMPVYYATGNKLQAFGWAMVSGIAEPIAALLGWAVLANSFSDLSYGILFGIVSGMMVIISARELLPTAHRYDPEDSVVTYSFMVGMAIMAVSLALFLL